MSSAGSLHLPLTSRGVEGSQHLLGGALHPAGWSMLDRKATAPRCFIAKKAWAWGGGP